MPRRKGAIWTERLVMAMILASLAGAANLVVVMHRRAHSIRASRPVSNVPPTASSPTPPTKTVKAPAAAPSPAPAPVPVPATVKVDDPTPKIVARLRQSVQEEKDAARRADERASALASAREAASAESKRWGRREALVRGQVAALSRKAERLEQDIVEFDAERDVLARERDALKAALSRAGRHASYAVLPYKGPNGTWRRPIVVECVGNVAVLQPAGRTFSMADLSPLINSRSSPFILEIAREMLRVRASETPDGAPAVPYLVFLVRPSGIRPYYEARARLAPLGIAFGYELIDQDLVVNVPNYDDVSTWDGTIPLDSPTPAQARPSANWASNAEKLKRPSGPAQGQRAGAFARAGDERRGGNGNEAGESSPEDFVWPSSAAASSGRTGRPHSNTNASSGANERPWGERAGIGGDGGALGGGGELAKRGGRAEGSGDGAAEGLGDRVIGRGDGAVGARGRWLDRAGRGGGPRMGAGGAPGDGDGRSGGARMGAGGAPGDGDGRADGALAAGPPFGLEAGGGSPASGFGSGDGPLSARGAVASGPGASSGPLPDLEPVPGGGSSTNGNGTGGPTTASRPFASSGDRGAAGVSLVPNQSGARGTNGLSQKREGDGEGPSEEGALSSSARQGPRASQESPFGTGMGGKGHANQSGNAEGKDAEEGSSPDLAMLPFGSAPPDGPPAGPGSSSGPAMGLGARSGAARGAGRTSSALGGASGMTNDFNALAGGGTLDGAAPGASGLAQGASGPSSSQNGASSGATGSSSSTGPLGTPSSGFGLSLPSFGQAPDADSLPDSMKGFVLPEIASPDRPPGSIDVPFEIVVVCRRDDLILQPGGYRISAQALREGGGKSVGQDGLLKRELTAMVRRRAQVDPLIRPRPMVKFLVEDAGGTTFWAARRQLMFSGLDWPMALRVAGAQDRQIFDKETSDDVRR